MQPVPTTDIQLYFLVRSIPASERKPVAHTDWKVCFYSMIVPTAVPAKGQMSVAL